METLLYRNYVTIFDGDEEVDNIAVDELDEKYDYAYKTVESAKNSAKSFLEDYKEGKIDLTSYEKEAEYGIHIEAVEIVQLKLIEEDDSLETSVVKTVALD